MRFLEKFLSMMITVLMLILFCGVALQNGRVRQSISQAVGKAVGKVVVKADEILLSAEKQAASQLGQANKLAAEWGPAIPFAKEITSSPNSCESQTKVTAPVPAADLKSVWGETGMKGLTVYEYGKTLLNNSEKACYCDIADAVNNLQPGVTLGTALSPSKIEKVYKYFINDHVELFYIGNVDLLYSNSGGNYTYKLTFEYKYGSKGRILAMRAQLQKKALEVLGITGGISTDLQKERALHDKLIELCSYDIKAAQNPDKYPDSYSAYGALVKGKAVCQGYAQAMKLLLSSAGIKSLYITGQANGGSHSWNVVGIGGQWYNLDATFDDPLYTNAFGNYENYNTVSYTYFNFSNGSGHAAGIFDSKDPFAASSENYAVMPRIS